MTNKIEEMSVVDRVKVAYRHRPGRLDRVVDSAKNIAKRAADKASKGNIRPEVASRIIKRGLYVKSAREADRDGAPELSKQLITKARKPKSSFEKPPIGWSDRSSKYYDAAQSMKEESVVNSAGGGNVAGLGVGPNGEPGVRKKDVSVLRRPTLKEGMFAGHKTFKVPSSVINEIRFQKKKGAHWTSFFGEGDIAYAIREYANSNPNAPIILEDEVTGHMCFARYGKLKKRRND